MSSWNCAGVSACGSTRAGAAVLKVPFQLDRQAVDLEESGLTDGVLQRVESLQMVGIVPVDHAELQVGPVGDFPFRQPPAAVAPLDELHERFDSIEQTGRRIGRDPHALLAELKPIRLRGQNIAVTILGRTNRHRPGADRQPNRRSSRLVRRQSQTMPAQQVVNQCFNCHVVLGHAGIAINMPRRPEPKFLPRKHDALRRRQRCIARVGQGGGGLRECIAEPDQHEGNADS